MVKRGSAPPNGGANSDLWPCTFTLRAHPSGPGALLGPVANATDVMGVLEADDCNAVLLGPLDANIHRFLGDHLAVARAAVDHDHRAIVANDLRMLVADAISRSSVEVLRL